jgi:hypothetical protein
MACMKRILVTGATGNVDCFEELSPDEAHDASPGRLEEFPVIGNLSR